MSNADALIFAGTRADLAEPSWQMPQGGIDKGETPQEAGLRELLEETGVTADDVTVLGETRDWLAYDLPTHVLPYRGKYRGQTQKWLHVRFEADDTAIDLTHDEVEFSEWRWMTVDEIIARIVPFKRPIYEQVLSEFGYP